jgi:hypothetical protein
MYALYKFSRIESKVRKCLDAGGSQYFVDEPDAAMSGD